MGTGEDQGPVLTPCQVVPSFLLTLKKLGSQTWSREWLRTSRRGTPTFRQSRSRSRNYQLGRLCEMN